MLAILGVSRQLNFGFEEVPACVRVQFLVVGLKHQACPSYTVLASVEALVGLSQQLSPDYKEVAVTAVSGMTQ